MKSFAKFSVDSGWSWVVCVASFLVQFAALGVPNSFGTFFVAFLQEFQEGESMTGKYNLRGVLRYFTVESVTL